MNSVTQDMAYRQSLMKYAEKFGVGRASRKYGMPPSGRCTDFVKTVVFLRSICVGDIRGKGRFPLIRIGRE